MKDNNPAFGAHTLSKMSRQAANFKEQHLQGKFAHFGKIGIRLWHDARQRAEPTRTHSAKAFRSTRIRVERWLNRRLTKLPFYPVDVARRPVPTEEDPRIAEKVEDALAWMKEHGINEALTSRKPPKAVGRTQTITNSVKRGGSQK